MGHKKDLSYSMFEQLIDGLASIPDLIEQILADTSQIQAVAKTLSNYKNFFFLGKQYQYPIAEEASLKFKELTYLNSQAYTT